MSWFDLLEIVFAAVLFILTWRSLGAVRDGRGTKKRIEFYDFAKGVSMLAIVTIHASDTFSKNAALKELLWPAIPVFIIISGALLAKRHGQADLSYLRRIVTVLIPIYLLFVIGIRIYSGQALSLIGIGLDALFGRTNGNYYFIPLLIQLYLLFPLLIKFKKHLNNPVVFAMIFLFSYLVHVWNFSLQHPFWNSNPWSLIFFGRYLVFFWFGMFLSQYRLKEMPLKLGALILGFFALGAAFFSLWSGKFYLTYVYPLAWPIGLVFMYRLLVGFRSILSLIGQHSLIIYLLHTRILYDWLFPLKGIPPIALFFVLIIVPTAISLAFSIVFMRGYTALLQQIRKAGTPKEHRSKDDVSAEKHATQTFETKKKWS